MWEEEGEGGGGGLKDALKHESSSMILLADPVTVRDSSVSVTNTTHTHRTKGGVSLNKQTDMFTQSFSCFRYLAPL